MKKLLELMFDLPGSCLLFILYWNGCSLLNFLGDNVDDLLDLEVFFQSGYMFLLSSSSFTNESKLFA